MQIVQKKRVLILFVQIIRIVEGIRNDTGIDIVDGESGSRIFIKSDRISLHTIIANLGIECSVELLGHDSAIQCV